MPTPCRDCARDIDHCHGTLIVHPHARPECTDPHCAAPQALRHSLVVDCAVAQCDCRDIGSYARRAS